MTKEEKEHLIVGATAAMHRAQEEARERSVEMGTSFIVAARETPRPYKSTEMETAVVNESDSDES